jgi:hypothetical protein
MTIVRGSPQITQASVSGLTTQLHCPLCTVTEACGHEHVFEAHACAAHAEGIQLDGARPVLPVRDRAELARLRGRHRDHLGCPPWSCADSAGIIPVPFPGWCGDAGSLL